MVPVLSWLVYVTVYLGRINISVSIPFLQSELGYSKSALGLLASGFFCAYAAGQLINGILGDRVNVKRLVSLGLLVAGISNIAFGIFESFPVMLFCWSINGYFQSMLWGPLLRAIAESVPRNRQYRAMFLMSTSPIVGHFLSYILAGRLAVVYGWKSAFLVPGIILLAAAVLWYFAASVFFDRGKEKDEKYDSRPKAIPRSGLGIKPSPRMKPVVDFIVQSRLYLAAIAGIFAGVIKEGLTLWGPAIFIEMFHFDMQAMLTVISIMPLINLIFIIFNGALYRKYPQKLRQFMIFYLAAAACFAFFLRLSPALFFFGIMASIFAVNNCMVSYLPLDYIAKGRVSAAAGIIGSAFYLGAALAGPLIGAAAQLFGWNGIFTAIALLCVLALVPCLFSPKPARVKSG